MTNLNLIIFILKHFKIYKNKLNLFINEPTFLGKIPSNEIILDFDLGSYIVSNRKNLNFFVGTDLKSDLDYAVFYSDLA